ncbi:hypothetical protein F4861DRAFT_546830 [Xylaria intraflava]|nr:hypothetical protein F4861DRAFT_546830 [Xylaria intraflava]
MSTELETVDGLPSYTEAAAIGPTTGSVNDDLIQPTILLLAGQTIHAQTTSSAPLYHLDRGIASLSRATSKVTLERVESTVRTNSDNEPSLRDRRRHIFTLEHSWTVYNSLPSNCPRFFARAASKRALGHVGLKKARLRSAFTALPLDVAGTDNKLGLPGFDKDAQPLFELHKSDGRWEWADKDGSAIAVEYDADDTHRLIVTAPLPRVTMDALVALWCCRLWEYSAEHTEEPEHGMDGSELPLSREKGLLKVLTRLQFEENSGWGRMPVPVDSMAG